VQPIPVVLIHGAWLHASSWEAWAERFAKHGYTVDAPGWPGEEPTLEAARRNPGPLRDLRIGQLLEHYERIARSCDTPAILVGHALGGLIAQRLLGAGIGQAAVAIAPQPPAGLVEPGVPNRIAANPFGAPVEDDGFVPMPRRQFRHLVANTVGEEEAAKLYERYVLPAPRNLLTDSGIEIDTGNAARGPLLLVSGQEDRMVTDALTRAAYKLYGDSTAATELKQFADRGHSLVIDSGWREVADYVLTWLADNVSGL
jgi:non-heme chloroperoxidase